MPCNLVIWTPESPFEFRALEVTLEAICSFIDARTTELETNAYPALDDLTSKVSKYMLTLLYFMVLTLLSRNFFIEWSKYVIVGISILLDATFGHVCFNIHLVTVEINDENNIKMLLDSALYCWKEWMLGNVSYTILISFCWWSSTMCFVIPFSYEVVAFNVFCTKEPTALMFWY